MKANPGIRHGDGWTGVVSHDDGAACRLTLVIPRRIAASQRPAVRDAVLAMCVNLGYPPRILAGRHVRVLTGYRVYRDV